MTSHGGGGDIDASGLAALLAPDVILRQAWIGEAQSPLFPEEAAAIAHAVPKRQREFTAGRHCARLALGALTGRNLPLPVGDHRMAAWPEGVVGSITHDDQWCAAAVAHRADVAGLGIDVELLSRFGPDLASWVCTPAELAQWPAAAGDASAQRAALARLFCAKEAVFKAQFPLTRTWLEFADAQVAPDANDTTVFRATLLRPAGPFAAGHVLLGRWAMTPLRCSACVVVRDLA